MPEIVYKLPKGVELSPDQRERAIAYLKLGFYGDVFYVPITKEIKKLFGLKNVNGKFDIPYKTQEYMAKTIRDIVESSYLQVRDNVCAGIESRLSQDLEHGFSKLFEKFIHTKVSNEVTKRLPDLTNEKTTI